MNAPAYLESGWRATKGPHPDNTSGFHAIGHRVLLRSDPVETTTSGGIILQSKTVEAEKHMGVWATVVEIGLDAWKDKDADACQVGDRVLLGKYTGQFHISPHDKQEYRFVMDLDVITPLNTRTA